MRVFCYNPQGFDGGLVEVEVDLRRGLPAIDIIGLAGGAVRESKERVRVALRRAGWDFPLGHIVVNLAPAGMPKVGAAFDLAIALAIAAAGRADGDSGAGPYDSSVVLAMGELTLSGGVLPAPAVVPALLAARAAGISRCVLPLGCRAEAGLLAGPDCRLVETLPEALAAIGLSHEATAVPFRLAEVPTGSPVAGSAPAGSASAGAEPEFDTGRFFKRPRLLAALLAAAAGRHHLLLYGPPGTGKTMALRFLGRILPRPTDAELLDINRVYSVAGLLGGASGLLNEAPVRMPHHGSSPESLLGGGRRCLPGEMALAHRGLLILDEAPEFRSNVLQALREPMEDGCVRLGRANGSLWFPADFILGLSLNPCPCGKLGGTGGACSCNPLDVQRYWARLGAPVLDRVDIRLRLSGAEAPAAGWEAAAATADRELADAESEYLGWIAGQVTGGVDVLQGLAAEAAARAGPAGRLRGAAVDRLCRLAPEAEAVFAGLAGEAAGDRSGHALLRLCRTLAALRGRERAGIPELAVAGILRRSPEVLPGLPLFR